MSTTVTYKGATLTTADNQTRTLLTAGKYLEDNVTITDTSSSYDDGDNMGYGDAVGTWYFNQTISYSNINKSFGLVFTSNGNTYNDLTLMIISYLGTSVNYIVTGSQTDVAYNNGWADPAYRTITITGGADVKDATLIDFLEANAVRQ